MRKIPDRLLIDRITILRPVQSFVPGTRKPVFEYQSIATNIPVRFNPAGTKVDHNVMGMTPRKSFRLFLNSPLLNENDEIIWEADGRRFRVTQVRSFFGHHYEAQAEET